VASIVPLRQNVPRCVQRLYVVRGLHCVFCSTRLGARSAAGHCILAAVAQKHTVTVHAFADDTQMYLHCSRDDTTSAADRLERCIADVCQWMSANRLKLNTVKAELLWVGTRHSMSQHGPFPVLQLGLDLITSSDYVRLLGATITSDLNLDRHVCVVSASCFYWIRQLRRTRCSLDQESAATLVHAFVTSRVDYCTVTPYWQVHQRSRLTSFKECSTLLLASLPVPTSSAGACRGCCTPSCTGSTYLSESHTSSE